MTSITWAGPRCVQEPAAILAPKNLTQGGSAVVAVCLTLALAPPGHRTLETGTRKTFQQPLDCV